MPEHRQRTEAYWEGVLQSEITRLDDDKKSRVVAVEDITFNAGDDDDLPIVNTLPAKETNLVILAAAAAKKRVKKAPKPLWTYETVAEPTGMASKYWDVEASTERATKRLAK